MFGDGRGDIGCWTIGGGVEVGLLPSLGKVGTLSGAGKEIAKWCE